MDSIEFSTRVARWMSDRAGLYVFAYKSLDEHTCDYLVDDILGSLPSSIKGVHRDAYRDDLSHCRELSGGVFVDNTNVIKKSSPSEKTIVTHRDFKVESLMSSQRANNNRQILLTEIKSDGGVDTWAVGQGLIYEADLIGLLRGGSLFIHKLRYDDEHKYREISLLPLVRQDKINKLIPHL